MPTAGTSVGQNGAINEDGVRHSYTASDSTWWNNRSAPCLVAVWLDLFFLLILGFGYSYFWSASTIIYLLMRRNVDEAELDEVYLEEEEAEEAYGPPTARRPAPAAAGRPGRDAWSSRRRCGLGQPRFAAAVAAAIAPPSPHGSRRDGDGRAPSQDDGNGDQPPPGPEPTLTAMPE